MCFESSILMLKYFTYKKNKKIIKNNNSDSDLSNKSDNTVDNLKPIYDEYEKIKFIKNPYFRDPRIFGIFNFNKSDSSSDSSDSSSSCQDYLPNIQNNTNIF